MASLCTAKGGRFESFDDAIWGRVQQLLLSKTLATHSGMTNDGLKQQGLISFRDKWTQAQGYI